MAADSITREAVDEILNLDFGEDDPFRDAQPRGRADKATLSPRPGKRKPADDDKENFGLGLGLDEEVKITKKRKPVAKLDEARLMSQPGLPKLRALAKSGHFAKKLHLKGKGHEFTDAARLLSYYQLWLDDLYPRAKFADALQLVEKAGHSKSMQRQRKEWIDEGKPGYIREREARQDTAAAREDDAMMSGALQDGNADVRASGQNEERSVSKSILDNEVVEEDGLFIPDPNAPRNERDEPDDDELDALLAGETAVRESRQEPESEDENELDALLAEQSECQVNEASSKPPPSNTMFDEDEDDLDTLIAEHEATRRMDDLPGSSSAGTLEATFAKQTIASETTSQSGGREGELDRPPNAEETKEHPGSDYDSDFDPADLEDLPMSPVKSNDSVREKGSQDDHSNQVPFSSPILNASQPMAGQSTLTVQDSNTPPTHFSNPSSNAKQSADTEPDLPDLPRVMSHTPTKDDSQGKERGIVFSSSPIPNDVMGLDDLNALLEGQGN